mgnify:FL=1
MRCPQFFSQRLKILISTVTMMLTIIIDVMGIKILLRPLSIRISPGSLPNQFSNQGANWKISPKARITEPAMMNQRAISSLTVVTAPFN